MYIPAVRRSTEFVALCFAFGVLTVILTYPLGLHPGSFARFDADGRFSIWNVAWVAHAITSAPLDLWNANIFYPASGTLSYSEANIAAGVLAAPVYWLTGNPYAAHNLVLLTSFVLSALGMYYRRLPSRLRRCGSGQ
jgi:hypothetical protein